MYYFGQKIQYLKEEGEVLCSVIDEGYISFLLGYAKRPSFGWTWEWDRERTKQPWAGFYKTNPEKYKTYWYVWVSQQELEESSSIVAFRSQKKGERIAHYRLCKKIAELDQKFKDIHYAKANNLPILIPIDISEDYSDDSTCYSDEVDEQPVPAL